MTPPKLNELSDDLKSQFSANHTIPMREWYMNESNIHVDHLYTMEVITYLKNKAKNRETNYYGKTDQWLYEALETYPIKDKSVLIIGSIMPWYESIAQEFGCKSCTVVEYRNQPIPVPGVEYIKPDVLRDRQFDCIFSISSYEHDGLGRYGDPINPDADLNAMKDIQKNIVDGGKIYLAVPVGTDEIVWNAHRVYGKVRLPKLIENWNLIGKFGITDEIWDTPYTDDCPPQPVLVLKK